MHIAKNMFFISEIPVFGAGAAVYQPFSGLFTNSRRNYPVTPPVASITASSP
jgi:hypothetical protein